MKSKKSIKTLVVIIATTLILIMIPSMAFAIDGATATVGTIEITPSVVVNAEGVSPTTTSTSEGKTYLDYNAGISQYGIKYDADMDMSSIWSEYEMLRGLAPGFANAVTISANTAITINFDSKLTVDASKLTVSSIESAFENKTPNFNKLWTVKDVTYDSSSKKMTIALGVKDGMTGAGVEAVKSDCGGSLPNANFDMPAGALTMSASKYADGDTIKTSNTTINTEIYIGVPSSYRTSVYFLMNSYSATLNDLANANHRVDYIVVPGHNTPVESTLYMIKAAAYKVDFDSCGGSRVADIAGITSGSTITRPEDPAYKGYKFIGWYTDRDFKNAWNFNSGKVTGDMTLYAKWEKASSVSVKTDSNAPGTGDSSMPVRYIALGGMSIALLLVIFALRHKKII